MNSENTSRVLWGSAIIVVGALLLLGNLGINVAHDILSKWWPLFVVGAGLFIFIQNPRSYLWALLVTGVGVVLQLNQLNIVDINPWEFVWPAALILLGLSLVFHKSYASRNTSTKELDDLSAILAGSEQKNTSDDYKGSKVTAIMGGVKIDLRKATIKEEAVIDVFGFWGGVEIVVPRNVVVKKQIAAVLGGVEDKTDQDVTKDAPVLRITGDVIMSGVEIKN